jgi:hypothetical protein
MEIKLKIGIIIAPSKNLIKSTVLTQLALERIKHFLFEDQRNKTREENIKFLLQF